MRRGDDQYFAAGDPILQVAFDFVDALLDLPHSFISVKLQENFDEKPVEVAPEPDFMAIGVFIEVRRQYAQDIRLQSFVLFIIVVEVCESSR